MKCQKLVRDLVPQLIEDDGDEAVVRVLDQDEYYEALREKLQEEVTEYLESEDPDELADIVEVVRTLVNFHSMSVTDLELTRQKKLAEHGGFDERLFLEEIIEN
jgi:predicted house-cleaning noncanonical NTP pyrophosphatase (MazG superfamily)